MVVARCVSRNSFIHEEEITKHMGKKTGRKICLPKKYPVACHTDNVQSGSTFVAIRGQNLDGMEFISRALELGAQQIVIDQGANLHPDLLEVCQKAHVEIVYVDNTRQALARLSAQSWGNPAHKLKIIGITGTKGKTTTAFLLHHILQHAGYKVAMLSTVYNVIDGQMFSACLTTPQPDYLHMFLAQCVKAGVTHVVMEVAAQALSCHRINGIEFDAAIMTNFSQEHGEFYATMDEYFKAKLQLFAQLNPRAHAIINADDQWCKKVYEADARKFVTVGCRSRADAFFAQKESNEQLIVDVSIKDQKQRLVCPTLLGRFNAYNSVMAIACAYKLGIPLKDSAQALLSFGSIPGRLEKYTLRNGATFFIDYAHNPDSYRNLFSLLSGMTEKLIVVFGAGGGRDKQKRPVMGAVAAEFAQHIVLTSDNPRYEDPQEIMQDIMQGIEQNAMHKVVCEADRQQAIKKAYQLSNRGAIVVVLGKGPDEYQIVKDSKMPFCEREIIQSL